LLREEWITRYILFDHHKSDKQDNGGDQSADDGPGTPAMVIVEISRGERKSKEDEARNRGQNTQGVKPTNDVDEGRWLFEFT